MPKVAWVTGGGTGIGRALAHVLYKDGYAVAISGRRNEVLAQAATEIGSTDHPGKILAIPGDVTDKSFVERAVQTVSQKWGDMDLLVNNAGVNPCHPFQETPLEEFEEIFKINCFSAILTTKKILPRMLTKNKGAIVNISSILGKWASHSSSAYSMSKYALAGFTDSLRQELSPTRIHVMGVYPGFIRTAMTEPFAQRSRFRAWLAASPQAMAQAILRGLRRRQRDVMFPWYVPAALHLYEFFPTALENLSRLIRR